MYTLQILYLSSLPLRFFFEGWPPQNIVNNTSLMAIVTQTDRSKPVRSRCVIDFCGVSVLSLTCYELSVGMDVVSVERCAIWSKYKVSSHLLYRNQKNEACIYRPRVFSYIARNRN